MNKTHRILDIVNTDHAALNFLVFRATWINERTEFQNDIVCSPGPHLAQVRLAGGTVTALDIPRGMSPVGMARLCARLVRLIRSGGYTIVHTHNSVTGAVGRLAARIAGVPLVIHTTHGFHFHANMGRLERMPYVAAERALARLCDALLFQNREEMEDMRRLELRPHIGGYYVGNGINLESFRPRAVTHVNPQPVILCIARLEAVKNHEMLFRALELLRPAFTPRVWLVGEGPLTETYRVAIERRGLADAVEFLGYRYDIPELTAAADISVLTSVKEGIPRALMQSMAMGVPVVATDVKGSREVVVDGETGFLVPLGDPQALANRLARLLGSPELRRTMGARGIEHVREQFDEAKVVERLVGIYRSALRAQGIVTAPAPAMPEITLTAERAA